MVTAKLEVLSEASVIKLMITIQNYEFLERRIFTREKRVFASMSL